MITTVTRLSLFSAAILIASSGVAEAQDPKFSNATDEELAALKKQPKKAEWKAGALAGLILTTGNARTTTMSAGAKASRRAGNNKLQLDQFQWGQQA